MDAVEEYLPKARLYSGSSDTDEGKDFIDRAIHNYNVGMVRRYSEAGFGGSYEATGNIPWYNGPDATIAHLRDKFRDTLYQLSGGGGGSVSPRQMIEGYYGGKTDDEIAKARYYANYMKGYSGITPSYREDYSGLDKQIPIEVGSEGNYYSPEDKGIHVLTKDLKQADTASDLAKVEAGDEDAIKMMKFNAYSPKILKRDIENPFAAFYNAAEHEVTHPVSIAEGGAPSRAGSYMGEYPSEMANVLGRIQREAYVQYGKRFDTKGFLDYLGTQYGIKDEDKFKGFSDEAKRGLKTIFDSYTQDREYPDKKILWKEAAYAIPGFVMSNTKKESDKA